MSFSGKVALITGASSGIGRGTALVLAQRGADIAANGRRKEALEDTVAKVRELERRALALPADVSIAEQVRDMVEKALDYFGHIDILVNNAGHLFQSTVEKTSDAEWQRLLAVHLSGAFYCTREVLPAMKRQGKGKIINISSVSGMVGLPEQVAYGTVKAGLLGFTKALAKELAPFKINVNAIAPGSFMTAIQDQWFTPESVEAKRRSIPWQRLGRPEEIGYLAAFLASEEADFITGQVFSPNGGVTIVGI